MAEPSSPLRTAFHNLPLAHHPAQWDSFYRKDFHPWDRDGPSLALADLLLQRTDLVPPAQEDLDDSPSAATTPTTTTTTVTTTTTTAAATPPYDFNNAYTNPSRQRRRRTALVPGCGRGHDALLLASFGYDVWGLDVSERGLELARVNERLAHEKGLYKTRDGMERGTVHWVEGDFFSDAWARDAGTGGSGRFDLIFDYTVGYTTSAHPLSYHFENPILPAGEGEGRGPHLIPECTSFNRYTN